MDYYAVLELDDTAEAPDIKKAYRRLCVQRHPDKSKSSNSTKDFLPLKDAYETLSEPDKKAQYDESRQSRHAFTQGADYMAPQAATAGPSSHQGGYYAPPNAARRQPQADDFYQHMYQRHNAYWNKIHAQYNGRYAGPAWQRPGGSEYNRENDARMREDESSRMGIPIPDIPDRDPQRAQYLDQRRQCLDQKREDELQFEMETTETFNQDAYKQWLNDEDVFGV